MFYTNQPRDDGFGSQFLSLVRAILYVEIHLQSSFIVTSPQLHHIYGDDASDLESIINLNSIYPNIKDTSTNSQITVVYDSSTYPYAEDNMDHSVNSATMDKIRIAFHNKNKTKYTSLFDRTDEGVVHVAIHVRRPSLHPNIDTPAQLLGHDVKSMSMEQAASFSVRFIHDERYLCVMKTIREKYKHMGKKCKFYIVSEGKPELFDSFVKSDDVILCVNKSIEESFCTLVYADVLVVSWSAFSYLAAMIKHNDVWCPTEFCHALVTSWIKY